MNCKNSTATNKTSSIKPGALGHMLQIALGAFDQGVLIIDPDFEIIWFNENLQKIYSSQKISHGKCYQVIAGQGQPCPFCPVQETLAKNKKISTTIWALEDLGIEWLEVSSVPLTDPETQELVGTMVTLTDVTESVQEKKLLKKHKQNLEITLNSIGDGVVATDREGKITILNGIAEELTGWSEKDALGIHFSKVLCLVNEETGLPVNNPIESVLETGEVEELANHTELVRKDGERFPVADSAAPITSSSDQIQGAIMVFRDASKERYHLETIRRSENFSTSILNSLIANICVLDGNGRIIRTNQGWEQFAQANDGVSHKSSIGINYLEECDRAANDGVEDGAYVAKKIRQVLQGDLESFVFEYPCHSEYERRWFLMRVTGLSSDERGGAVIAHYDITDRKTVQEKMEKSEKLFRLLAENAQDIIYRINLTPRQHFEYVSPSVTGITGYTPQDHYDDPKLGFKLIHPDDRKVFEKILTDADTIKNPILLRWVRKDGNVIWTEQTNVPIYNKYGQLIAIEGIARDITQRMETSDELRKLSQAVEQSPNTVVITDIEGQIEYVNPKFTELTGYTPEEAIGMNPRILKSGQQSDQIYKELWETISRGEDWRGDFHNKKKNGEIYWEIASISPIRNARGEITHFVKVAEDITKRKLAEAKLAAYAEDLEEKSKELEVANGKIKAEIDKARQLHQQFLPTDLPDVEKLTFDAYYLPAKDLGGDFYNLLRIENQLIIYLADVSGHGLDGAMLNIFVRDLVKSFAYSHVPKREKAFSVKDIVKFIAEQYRLENFPEDYFICLLVGSINLETMEFSFCNAGFQTTPLLAGISGKMQPLISHGLPISTAIDEVDFTLEEKQCEIKPGDTLFLTTDGLVEEMVEGQMYGEERLKQVLEANKHLPPRLISQEIVSNFKEFSGDLQGEDDITFMVLQSQPDFVELKKAELTNNCADLEALKYQFEELMIQYNQDPIPLLIGLQEMVYNAIEHGNKFSPDKKVKIELAVTKSYIKITVEDEGNGFDWRQGFKEKFVSSSYAERGRGFFLTQMSFDYIYYNERGNKVSLIKLRNEDDQIRYKSIEAK